MAVYNGERFLAEAVESVLAQSFDDFEFVIIDDGSQDRTSAILERYRRSDPRIVVRTQCNRGHAASLNTGCQRARARYIARMDADDLSLQHRLERQVAFLDERPGVAVVGGAVHLIDSAGTALRVDYCPTNDTEIRKTLPWATPFYHPMIMMRRAHFGAIGGYRVAFEDAEDYDLYLRVAERYQLANLAEPIGCYRISEGQVSHRSLRRQRAAHLAAQASAKARAAQRPDPMAGVERITGEMLRALGVTDAALEASCVAATLERIELLLEVGAEEAALGLLEDATDRTHALGGRRKLAAMRWRMRGRQSSLRGERLRSLCAFGRAACLEPSLARALLVRGRRRLIGWLAASPDRPKIRPRRASG